MVVCLHWELPWFLNLLGVGEVQFYMDHPGARLNFWLLKFIARNTGPAVTHIVPALSLMNPKTNRRHKHFKQSCQMIDTKNVRPTNELFDQ